MTQQKTLKMLTRSRRDLPDDAAQPDQVAGDIGPRAELALSTRCRERLLATRMSGARWSKVPGLIG